MNNRTWTVLSEQLAPPFDPERKAEIPVLEAADAHLCLTATPDEWLAGAQTADAILHWRFPIGEREIGLMEKCRIIAHYGVGVDRIDVAAAAEAGIFVTNVPDYGVNEVADHAMTLLLASARKLPDLERTIRGGQFNVLSVRPIWRLRGRTLGILGLGRIGSAVARRAAGFGFELIACDPYVPDEQFTRLGVRRVGFEELLTESDLITLHLPLVPETRGLIDRQAFASMRPGVVLVNTARGPIIDEAALLDALAGGTVAAAGLDVYVDEPLPLSSPLLQDPRIILTPHAAFFSEESIVDMQAGASRQVAQVFSGQRPTAAAVLPGLDWGRAEQRWVTHAG